MNTPKNSIPEKQVNLLLSDWEKARILDKRAFFERSTNTIRSRPENYCLAYRRSATGIWWVYTREAATKGKHHLIARVLAEYSRWSTADALAEEIGKVLGGAS